MHEVLEGLKPEPVWRYFDRLRQTPRCSKHEEKASLLVQTVAKELGLEYKVDELGNVNIIKPATPGYEDKPPVCLQAHVDMVCEKNSDKVHDFSKDPIDLERDGDYITAKGTTLGADDGIGVSTLLALAEAKDIKHPKLELLFTVDEETGMTGAFNMKSDFIESKRLINVDSEEEGSIYIGCAGGGDTEITLDMGDTVTYDNMHPIEFTLKGMKGGHSGVDINLGRANALKSIARIIYRIGQEQKVAVAYISGGDKRNAIPREGSARILVEDVEKAKSTIKTVVDELLYEYEDIEESIDLEYGNWEGKEAFSMDSSRRLVNLIFTMPHGYLAFNPNMKDLVDTSTNLASVHITDGKALVITSSRSSMKSAMENVRDMISALANLTGAEAVKGGSYPSWKPNMKSELLKTLKDVYVKTFGKEAVVKAIHAGLETAIIGEHFPGMDLISIGPQIEFPHSPDERVLISSVEHFWTYLTAVLEVL